MSIFEKSEKLQKCVGLECIYLSQILTHSAKGGKCQIKDWHKMLSVWMNLCPETSPANDACVIWIFQQIFWIFQQIFWIFQQICKTPIHPSHSDSSLQLSPTPIELQFHLKLDRPTLNLCNLKAKKMQQTILLYNMYSKYLCSVQTEIELRARTEEVRGKVLMCEDCSSAHWAENCVQLQTLHCSSTIYWVLLCGTIFLCVQLYSTIFLRIQPCSIAQYFLWVHPAK